MQLLCAVCVRGAVPHMCTLPCVCLLLFSAGEASEEEVKERQARAMADPEVQNILMDPVMRQVCVVLYLCQ